MLGVEIMHRGSAQVAAPQPPDFDVETSRLAQLDHSVAVRARSRTPAVVPNGNVGYWNPPNTQPASWWEQGARTLAGDRADIGCVFYGHLFRRPGRRLGGEDLAVLGPEDVTDPADAEVLAAWWQAAVDPDPGVVPPAARTLGPARGVQAALAALSGSRFLAGTTELLPILWLRQVRAYFTQPGLREQNQQRFSAAVGPDTEVVVAHSLGSVVAYEGLCALWRSSQLAGYISSRGSRPKAKRNRYRAQPAYLLRRTGSR
jgi:hypothetical protein